MIFGIGHVQRVAVERHALRSKESCTIECAIVGAVRAGANRLDQRAVEPGDDDSVVIGISDEQALALRVSQNFAGKSQWQIANLGALKHKIQRLFVEFSALAKFGNRLANRFIDRFIAAFA